MWQYWLGEFFHAKQTAVQQWIPVATAALIETAGIVYARQPNEIEKVRTFVRQQTDNVNSGPSGPLRKLNPRTFTFVGYPPRVQF